MLLTGLKVVEMSTWVAAPGCAMIMAEWGADVIKVEGPEGDAIRRFYPDTPESPATRSSRWRTAASAASCWTSTPTRAARR